MYKGTGASPGIALGRALVIEHSELVIEKKTIENIDEEIQKLESAVKVSKEELTKVKEKALAELGEHEAEIFEAHLLVLEDPELVESAVCKINDEKVNAEFALNEIKYLYFVLYIKEIRLAIRAEIIPTEEIKRFHRKRISIPYCRFQ